MRKVKGVLRNEKWANKILFTVVVAVLVVLVGSWSSLAALLENVNPYGYSGGYGYGYFQEGHKWFGYHTYGYQPLKDLYGFHPNGSLIKRATSGDIYWIDEGTKRWVRSPVAFESWGFNWSSVITVSDAEFNAYDPASNPYLLMRPGTLVKRFHDPGVFIFGFDDQLHQISSPEVFNNLGLRWGDIREITFMEFNIYTVGSTITSSAIPAGASLLKGSGPNVYLWESGATYATEWIRSPVAFESWGFNWGSIITISDVELGAYLATYPGADIMAKPGTLIRGSTPEVYIVDNLAVQEMTPLNHPLPSATYLWKKRWITSPDVFNAKGFRWEDIKTESDAEIASYTTSTSVM